jgi:hypothetical protein
MHRNIYNCIYVHIYSEREVLGSLSEWAAGGRRGKENVRE